MLFERLTEDEKEIIEILRSNYCDSEESDFFRGDFVDTQTFLRFWESAKAPMAEAFGDRLIVKKPLNVMMEDDELFEKMQRVFWMSEFNRVREAIWEMAEEFNKEAWFERTISTAGHRYSMYELFHYQLFDCENWVANRYDGPTCEIKLADGNVMKLAHGCKLMKALGRMAKACGESVAEDFEVLRLRQSQVLNEARINANLCISIHPLDFMTASYNNNDWRSCMCWEDGEYRRGVIEMMNSAMVVVAYVESKGTVLSWGNRTGNSPFEWNSKRWREFFIVRPDMISGIKGYPYWNRVLEDAAITMLRDMFTPVFNAKYSSKIYTWNVTDGVSDSSWDLDVIPEMQCGPAMYNDFYSDNEYHSVFAYGLHNDGSGYRKNTLRVFYSGESECVVCGEIDCDFDGEGEIACTNCIEHYQCCKCGDSIYYRRDLMEINGLCYCPYCYKQLEHCDCCDEVIDPDNDEDSLQFCVSWGEYDEHNSSTDDVLREVPPEGGESWYREQDLIVCHICGDCAEKVFKTGRDELYAYHNDHREYYHYYTAIPFSHLTKYGIKTLLPSDAIEFFKARHDSKALSA